MAGQHTSAGANYTAEKLFLSLSEQLSHTFLLIARSVEQPGSAFDTAAQQETLRRVHDIAEAATQLTEAYALSARLRQQMILPKVEPVAISSLFYEAVQELMPLAKHYGVELRLDDLTRMQPVVGDAQILRAALFSLGQIFVLAAAENDTPMPVQFAAHRSRYGIIAGIYTPASELSVDAFRRAKKLYAATSQPLSRLVSGPATGVFVADTLLQSLSTKLHVARYRHLTGLAVTLPMCKQLQLV